MNTKKKAEGEFYTPEIFANFAHDAIAKHFGKDWYEKYIVWDPAWGIGNLTATKKFGHLYASTLHQSDIDESTANPEAERFQFDFLNDPIKSLFGLHIPESLFNALEKDLPIIFLMNPPYAAASDMIDGYKDVSTFTYVQSYMGNLKGAKQNLFSQFLYRVMMLKKTYKLTNCNICVFSSSVFMSGSGYTKFRKEFLNDFTFLDGYLFNASHFDDCSKRWGVSFSIWKSGKSEDVNNFPHQIIDQKDGEIIEIGKKNIYNIDNLNSFRNFCKEPNAGKKTYPTITLKNPVTVGDKEGSMMTTDAIGFYVNNANNVYKSMQSCYIMSSAPANVVSGFSITKDNFLPVCANFASRKVISNNWINNKDEFLAPNINEENHEIWAEFIADSIVYSMFQAASCQSAMRDADWKGYKYRIKNEFFFMSRKDMMELCSEYDNYDILRSTFDDTDRYAYELISGNVGNKMSQKAINVLEFARKLVIDTFSKRTEFNEKYPELHVNEWDAGYYQLRPMWKMYAEDDLKKFRKLYKELGKKLNKQVYELGILK